MHQQKKTKTGKDLQHLIDIQLAASDIVFQAEDYEGRKDCSEASQFINAAPTNATTAFAPAVLASKENPVTGVEARVLAQVVELGVEHEVVPCPPEMGDSVDWPSVLNIAAEDGANTILITGKPKVGQASQSALCIVLTTARLDLNGTCTKRLGMKASFAGAELTRELTGMEPGGVTPFGLVTRLPIWLDAEVVKRPWVIIGGGGRDRALKLAPGGILALPGAEVVESLAKAIDA